MEVKGTLDTMPLPELIRWLSDSRQTGTLEFQIGPVRKKLFFRNGEIISASSSNPREFLGQFLLRKGWISEGQLIKAVEEQLQTGKMLGSILIEKGWLKPDQLNQALREKAADTIYSLFICEEATFEFHAGELPSHDIVPIGLSVDAILMEGAVRSDEWRHIRELFPGLERTILARVEGAVFPRELRQDMLIYKLYRSLDGQKSLGEIALAMYESDYEILRAAARLMDAGLVKRVGEVERKDMEGLDIPFEDLITAVRQKLEEGDYRASSNLLQFIKRRYGPGNAELEEMESKLAQKLLQEYRKAIPPTAVPELEMSLDEIMNLRLDPMQGFMITRVNGIYDVKTLQKLIPIPEEKFYYLLKQLIDMKIIRLR